MISICEDLGKEQESLDEIVCGLEEEQWLQPTMFSGWSVRDEITHLAFLPGCLNRFHSLKTNHRA